jgi:hypothetical protein
MSGEKVVCLPGNALPVASGTPHEGIIAVLEEALAQAKSGRLVGLGIAKALDDGTPDGAWDQKSHFHPARGWLTSIAINGLKIDFDDWLYRKK